jgi:hypothetical protein
MKLKMKLKLIIDSDYFPEEEEIDYCSNIQKREISERMLKKLNQNQNVTQENLVGFYFFLFNHINKK